MSSFEREFNSAVEAVERDVFINLVLENPQLTLAELTKLGKGKFANLLSSVSVGDILEGGRAGGTRSAAEGNTTNNKKKKRKQKTKPVNTRTPEGRKAYDAAVFAVVENAERPIKAPEITAEVGGTALQVRKSLARLIDRGRVTWEGKARGMRYSTVEFEDDDEIEDDED
ncbi:hypothetical protein G6O69_13190 [Pseudenhygromyxa sp. WMMC2535]|uniref:hypothetical protein n=1 Tax=Pseudenhygromyxa sp. WMMC2535 TaxID=2712867 RepID=UPI00155776FA|nr:hypothetical protein [Pseudenhygromyxa sp. WMMC2535]NVB38789.1 hypothetical protein [Pseudenhygromyxa sp. WMMC2535]